MPLPSRIKALILDMDGVLWKADSPIGDLASIFRKIRQLELKFLFATNNSTQTPEEYAHRLVKFGVNVEPSQIVTSALCTAFVLKKILPYGARVFAVGESGLLQALDEQNFRLLTITNADQAQAVVVGHDRQVTFEKMREATLLVRKGVPFYGTNPDKTFPTPRGEIPGTGAWLSVITTATDIKPTIIGKPSTSLFEMALNKLDTRKEITLVVGDRLETDIVAAQALGCPCALVMSGVSNREQAELWEPPVDIIAEDLTQLLA